MIINVSGRAERDVAPDLGVVQLTIGFSGNDKAVVLAKAHEKANWLAEQIEALPADELVKYSSDGVRNYSYTRQEKKVKQVIHEASCSFAVTFKDLAALSQRTQRSACSAGVMFNTSMLTCAGRDATQRIASATSSAKRFCFPS